jgi:uncharacterized protein (DUF39 family)
MSVYAVDRVAEVAEEEVAAEEVDLVTVAQCSPVAIAAGSVSFLLAAWIPARTALEIYGG